jgi:hypothetical protein
MNAIGGPKPLTERIIPHINCVGDLRRTWAGRANFFLPGLGLRGPNWKAGFVAAFRREILPLIELLHQREVYWTIDIQN